MSYDILVFDPEVAPKDNRDFLSWYRALMQGQDGRDTNSPDVMSGRLLQFFAAIRTSFPPMNGPFAFDYQANMRPVLPARTPFWQQLMGRKPAPAPPAPVIVEAFVTDYMLTPNAIYMSFVWSVAEQAKREVFGLAMKNGLGFFEVSTETPVPLLSFRDLEDSLGL